MKQFIESRRVEGEPVKTKRDLREKAGDICLLLFAVSLGVFFCMVYFGLWYVVWFLLHSGDSFGRFGGVMVGFMLWLFSVMELMNWLLK